MRHPFLVLLTLSASCTGGGDAPAAATERDSAGIRIVENGATPPASWTIASAPLADIGGAGSGEHGEFSQVVHAQPLPDGRLVAFEATTSEFRFFDSTGAWLGSAGRQGSGPGEFQSPMWMTAAGGRLHVYDVAHRRLSVLDSAGSLLRSVAIASDAPGAFFFPSGVLADGRYLIQHLQFRFPFPGAEGEVLRDSAWVLVYDTAGAVADTVGRFPANEVFGYPVDFGQGPGLVPMGRPFAPTLSVASSAGRVYVSTGDRWEVSAYDPDGGLSALIRSGIPTRRLSEADVKRFREYQRNQPTPAGMPAQFAETFRAVWDKAPYPATLPAISRILTDEAGNLWTQEPPVTEADPARWIVVDPSGRLLAGVTAPPRLRITWVGADRLAGVWVDEDDVPHVRVYRLER